MEASVSLQMMVFHRTSTVTTEHLGSWKMLKKGPIRSGCKPSFDQRYIECRWKLRTEQLGVPIFCNSTRETVKNPLNILWFTSNLSKFRPISKRFVCPHLNYPIDHPFGGHVHHPIPRFFKFFGMAAGIGSATLPSGNLLHSYWKSPFIVDFPIENGDFP